MTKVEHAMKRFSAFTIFAVLTGIYACMSSAGCSKDPPASFHLRIRSENVVLSAVQAMEIIVRPRELDRRFPAAPEQTFEGGKIRMTVSTRGELVINVAGDWVQEHAPGTPMGDGALWAVDVPMWASDTSQGQIDRMDPELRVSFLRADQQIALGQAFLPWPVTSGAQSQVLVGCLLPTWQAECSDMEGVHPDAGM